MATQVQLRRGTQAQNDAFIGAIGEISVDTTNKRIRVHDGSTAGGIPVAKLSDVSGANFATQAESDTGTDNAKTVSPLTTSVAARTAATPATGDYVEIQDISDANKTRKALISDIIALVPAGSSVPTGTVLDYVGATAPSGYIFASGRTIGNAASGATERANADTQTLYELLWNSMANTEAAVSSGRGASAAADFAANKTIAIPDLRGRTVAGKDNMGGTTASRLTATYSMNGTTLGTAGGAEQHTLTAAQMPAHTHSETGTTRPGAGGRWYSGIDNSNGAALESATSTGSAGSSSAHPITQPTYICNKIIKL